MASGGVVDALKRYDRNLNVRWSWEKKKWAVESPTLRPDKVVPPVRFERIPGTTQYLEVMAPPYSEKRICFDRKTNVLFWIKKLTWDIVELVIESDVKRFKRREDFFKSVEKQDAVREKEVESYEKDMKREAYKFYRWAYNRSPMAY